MELTNNIKHELRTPRGMHKEYMNNLIYTFSIHWMEYHNNKYGWKTNNIEIAKQDSRGCVSITLYEGSRHVAQDYHGETTKDLLQFMAGFIHDKKWHNLKEGKGAE